MRRDFERRPDESLSRSYREHQSRDRHTVSFGPEHDYDRSPDYGIPRRFGWDDTDRRIRERGYPRRGAYDRHPDEAWSEDIHRGPYDRDEDRRYDDGRRDYDSGYERRGYDQDDDRDERRDYGYERRYGRGYDAEFGRGYERGYGRDFATTSQGRGGQSYDEGYTRPGNYDAPLERGTYSPGGERNFDRNNDYRSTWGSRDYDRGGIGRGQDYDRDFERGRGDFSTGEGRPGEGSRRRWDGFGEGPHVGVGPKGYEPNNPERIREDVCERLTRHGHLDARHISIRVEGQEVTLEGEVDSRRAKRLAEDLAVEVRGVRDVHNHLRINREGWGENDRNAVAGTATTRTTGTSQSARTTTESTEGSVAGEEKHEEDGLTATKTGSGKTASRSRSKDTSS